VIGLRVVFVGTPDFADASLKALLDSTHEVIAVVTQPDRPVGRGMQLCCGPVKRTSQACCIPVLQPERIADSEVVSQLRELAPDAIVVVAYGQKISKSVLDIPKCGCINVHGSLLPEYRGAAPINRAIMDGQDYTGVTTMYMDEGWDTGDMILARKVRIGGDMTAGELHDVLAQEGARLLVETLDLIQAGTAPRIPQDHSQATYAPKLTNEDCCIDWSMSAESVRNHVRGLNPYPGASTVLGDTRLKVWEVAEEPFAGDDGVPLVCGLVIELPRTERDGIKVKCGRGCVRITRLQPENRRPMSARDFTLGYKIAVGEVFGLAKQG
jgi:methionyl-tRNA formyltransferase